MSERLSPVEVIEALLRINDKLARILAVLEERADAVKARQIKVHDQPEHLRDGEGRSPAEAGGGGEPAQGEGVGGEDTAEAPGQG
jgi:hypothetical protein